MIRPSAILNVGGLVAAGLGALFHVLAARGLGPEGYGAFAAALAYVTLWAVVMEGGTGVALTREASADPRRLGWAHRMAVWRSALGLAGIVAAPGSAWLLRWDPAVIGLVAVLAVGMAAQSFMRLAFAVFRVEGRFAVEAAASVLQKVVLVLVTAAAFLVWRTPLVVAVAFAVSLAVATVATLGPAWRAVTGGPPAPASAARPPAGFFTRTCVPLLAIELLTTVYFRVDQVLLLQLRGADESGLYGAAYRVVEAALLLVGGSMTVLFPRLARQAAAAPGAFRADFVAAWRTLWVAALVLVVNGWLWAASCFSLFFGPAYVAAETSLIVLLGAIPLAYVNSLLTQSLMACGRERVYAVVTAVCAGVNVGLNVVVIPRWGASGAAAVTVVTEGVLLAGSVLGLRPIGRSIPLGPTLATGSVAAGAVAAGWWWLADSALARATLAAVVSAACWRAVVPRALGGRWAGTTA